MQFGIRTMAASLAALALASCTGMGGNGSTPYVPSSPALRSSATIGAKPAKLSFTTTPTLKLTFTEAKYTGTFAITSNPTGIVKLSKSSVKGPSAKITVTALAAGKATITAKDKAGQTKAVPVTVTQGVIIIQ